MNKDTRVKIRVILQDPYNNDLIPIESDATAFLSDTHKLLMISGNLIADYVSENSLLLRDIILIQCGKD